MWELPDLGPLAGHGLANPRDFLYPVAHIDDDLHVQFEIVMKNNGKTIALDQDHSPFDVVAWHGNGQYRIHAIDSNKGKQVLTKPYTQSYHTNTTSPNSPLKTQPQSTIPTPQSTQSSQQNPAIQIHL